MIHRYWLKEKNKRLSEEAALQTVVTNVVTEKSFLLSKQSNQYVFEVADWASKIQIKEALQRMFEVDVLSVNTLRVKGKVRRFKGVKGGTSPYKKAIVRVKEGQSLSEDWKLGELK